MRSLVVKAFADLLVNVWHLLPRFLASFNEGTTSHFSFGDMTCEKQVYLLNLFLINIFWEKNVRWNKNDIKRPAADQAVDPLHLG